METVLIAFLALVAVVLAMAWSGQPKKPPPPDQVKCPGCGNLVARACPNCRANLGRSPNLDCRACGLTAAVVPCPKCKIDIKKVPPLPA